MGRFQRIAPGQRKYQETEIQEGTDIWEAAMQRAVRGAEVDMVTANLSRKRTGNLNPRTTENSNPMTTAFLLALGIHCCCIAHNVGLLNLPPSRSMAGVETGLVNRPAALVALDMLTGRMGSVGSALSENELASEPAGLPCEDKSADAVPVHKPVMRKLAETVSATMAAVEYLTRKTVGDN